MPQYLKNVKGGTKIQKENKGKFNPNDKSLNMTKNKEISKMSRIEMERMLHMKGKDKNKNN